MSTHRQTMSDAAALLVAHVSGDTDAASLVIERLAAEETRAPLATMLLCLVHAAGDALTADLVAAAERGDTESPAMSYLVALSRYAHRVGEGG
jgi:hypothetical protein